MQQKSAFYFAYIQVRVCDGCFEKIPSGKSKPPSEVQPPASGQSASGKSDKPLPVDAKKTAEQRARELKQAEEDELNLALAISQSEAEAQVAISSILYFFSFISGRCLMGSKVLIS